MLSKPIYNGRYDSKDAWVIVGNLFLFALRNLIEMWR